MCDDDLGLAPLECIKIDIEGFEPQALRGLLQTLQDSPRVKILSEFSPLSIMEGGIAAAVVALDGRTGVHSACAARRPLEQPGVIRHVRFGA